MDDLHIEHLRTIGFSQYVANWMGAFDYVPVADRRLMRIARTQRDRYTLHDGEGEHTARALPHLLQQLQQQHEAFTIGDWVMAERNSSGETWITARVPPGTQIARRANDGRRQPLASNVDTALLVMGLDADFNPRRMERYIAMVRACDVSPVVVLTKCDIAPDAQGAVAQLRARLPASVPVVAVNGQDPHTRLELAPWLFKGQTLVMLGSSGAGKSTLTNTLSAGAGQDTGPVRRGDGRGQHTTTARSLHRCAEGGCIIDTPGLRTWRPDADDESLAATFEDIQFLATQCRFHDCRHEAEPGCAVRGEVDPDRLLNYHKLRRDAQRSEMTPLGRIALRRKWKRLGKAGAQRAREKRQ